MNPLAKSIEDTRKKIERAKRLEYNEKQIRSAMNSIASGLRDIYTHGLWQDKFSSFEEYCLKTWGITRQRAHQILSAENTRLMLSDGTEPQVASAAKNLNAGQAAELNGIPKEQAIEILREAISQPGKMTAKKIKQAKARVIDPAPINVTQIMSGDQMKDVYEAAPQPEPETLPPAANPEMTAKAYARALSDLIEAVDYHWSFDSGQQHTHSWHDKQDFLQSWREKINALPKP